VFLVVLELLVFAAAENTVEQVTAFKVGRHSNLTFFVFISGVVPVQVLG